MLSRASAAAALMPRMMAHTDEGMILPRSPSTT
jgi:hypothetical protein